MVVKPLGPCRDGGCHGWCIRCRDRTLPCTLCALLFLEYLNRSVLRNGSLLVCSSSVGQSKATLLSAHAVQYCISSGPSVTALYVTRTIPRMRLSALLYCTVRHEDNTTHAVYLRVYLTLFITLPPPPPPPPPPPLSSTAGIPLQRAMDRLQAGGAVQDDSRRMVEW